MTDQPPYVEVAERLMVRIAKTTSGRELDALWKEDTFRNEYGALPVRGKKLVNDAGSAQRALFMARAI